MALEKELIAVFVLNCGAPALRGREPGQRSVAQLLAGEAVLILDRFRRVIRRVDALVGGVLSAAATATALGDLLAAQCRPLDNVPYDAAYRRKVILAHARRALAALVAAG